MSTFTRVQSTPPNGLFKSNRRFLAFSQLIEDTLGFKAHKLVVDAGFTCPNWDGTVGSTGCTYCSNRVFSPGVRRRGLPVAEQVRREMVLARERYGATKFLVYFQAFSNTYAPVERLKALYDEALQASPDVVGFSVGTRPDCVPDNVLDLLGSYARNYHVWVELGLQSRHDETLKRIRRGHDGACFEQAVRRTAERGLFVAAHLILGFPWETPDMERQTIDCVARLPIRGVKLHHLHVVRSTRLNDDFTAGLLPMLAAQRPEDHVRRVCDALERLPPTVALMRWCGEIQGRDLVAPVWGLKKLQILRMIEDELERRDSWQGCRYAPNGTENPFADNSASGKLAAVSSGKEGLHDADRK